MASKLHSVFPLNCLSISGHAELSDLSGLDCTDSIGHIEQDHQGKSVMVQNNFHGTLSTHTS